MSSLRFVIHGAAPCPATVKQRLIEWLGPIVGEYYAATEGGGTLATPQDWLAHPGTVGSAWPVSQIKVVDDDGNACHVVQPESPGRCLLVGDHGVGGV